MIKQLIQLNIKHTLYIFLFLSLNAFSYVDTQKGNGYSNSSSHYHLAKKYYDKGLYYKSIDVLENHILELEKNKLINASQIANSYLLMADIYDQLSIIDKFYYCVNQLDYYNKISNQNDSLTKAIYYSYLSRYYNLRMIRDKGYLYSLKSIKYLPTNAVNINSEFVIKILTNHVLSIRNQSITLSEKIQLRDSIEYLIETTQPTYYPSISYYILSSNMFELDYFVNRRLNNDTIYFADHKQTLDINIYKLKNEIKRINAFTSNFHPLSARIHSIIALYYINDDKLDNALKHIDTSITMITQNYISNNTVLSPLNSNLLFAYTLQLSCLYQMYLKTNNVAILKQCENSIQRLEEVWYIYNSLRIDRDNFYNKHNYFNSPYVEILKIYYELYKCTSEEKYKQLILKTGILSKHYSEKHIQNNKNSELKNEMYRAFILFDEKQIELKKPIPTITQGPFYNKQNIADNTKINEVKNALNKEEALIIFSNINYNNTQKLLVQIIEKNKDTILMLNTATNTIFYKDSIMHKFNMALQNDDAESFIRYSSRLYFLFMKEVEKNISKHILTLRIYQDPIMENFNLPFELLITDNQKQNHFKNLSYLNKRYNIIYAYDINNQKITKNKITIFASSNAHFSKLLHTDKLISELQKKYSVEIKKGDKCTKKHLEEALKKEDVVMVVSHGEGNKSELEIDKGLYLTDGIFTISDIKNLTFKSNLVILLGCNIGQGFNSKEGNINFSRALLNSGVKSVVYADWDIDEKISTEIVLHFFDELKNKHSKSKSLALAINKTKEQLNARLNNPYYWGTLKVLGNDSPIILETTNENIFFIAFVLLVALLFIFFVYKL